MTRTTKGPVRRAVEVHLKALDIDAKSTPLAMVAMALAAQLDNGEAKSQAAHVSRELRHVLATLEAHDGTDAVDQWLDGLRDPAA